MNAIIQSGCGKQLFMLLFNVLLSAALFGAPDQNEHMNHTLLLSTSCISFPIAMMVIEQEMGFILDLSNYEGSVTPKVQ